MTLSQDRTMQTRPTQNAPPPRPVESRTVRWRADISASLVVFLISVPLSLGIALASGAPLMAGLIAAVVGGVVAGLLGGSPLQVSGPAAGLTIVMAELITRFGWQVTCLITIGAGLLQIVFGLLRVARFTAAVPPSVVHGMLAGIGLTIALAQLHVVLGGDPPTGVVASLMELPARIGAVNPGALVVGVATVAMLVAWPRLPKRIRVVPGPLVAVVAGTGLALLFAGVPRVELPGGLLDAITLPTLLPDGDWAGIAAGVLTVALVASVESLLSAVAVDRMHDGPRTNSDRELLGQGAANTVSGLLGGLPVTGVIVRSAANVEAGARTRASAVLHGVWIAIFAILLIGLVEMVPLAALAGLLVVIGLQLVKPADIRSARKHSELTIYLSTVVGVLLLGLIEGVGLGLLVAGLLMLSRVARARTRIEEPASDGEPYRVVVEGTLSFLSVPALSRVLNRVPVGSPARLDLVVDYLDHTAYDHLDAWADRHRRGGSEVQVSEPGGTGPARRGRYATWSHWQGAEPEPVLAGVAAYHSDTAPLLLPTFRELAAGQCPSALLLTCADSRVVPNVITRSGPGDLFTVQNVGNLVAGTSVRAAVQYATTVLDVPAIAVCGHSGCGAMRGLFDHGDPDGALGDWLRAGAPSLDAFHDGHPVGRSALANGFAEVDALAMVNVALQLDVLRAQGVRTDLLGLFFDIPTARVLVLDGDEFRSPG